MNDPQVQVDYEPLELPEGVRHHQLSGFAESWTAYDALTAERGWIETQHDAGTSWKRAGSWADKNLVTVFAPPSPRPEPLPIDTSGDFGEPDRPEDIPF